MKYQRIAGHKVNENDARQKSHGQNGCWKGIFHHGGEDNRF